MVIGIDGNEANVKNRVGVGQYAYQLLKHIDALIQSQTLNLEIRVYLKNKPLRDFPKEKSWWRYEVFGSGGFWVEKDLAPRLWREKFFGKAPDVFWSPTHYAPVPCPIPSVISIMDLGFERFPEYFKKRDLYQLKIWTGFSVRQAKKILTISEFSKKEIIKIYSLKNKEITAIPLACDSERFNKKIARRQKEIDRVREKYGINGDYLLYLGTLQPRKNLVRLVEAYASLKGVKPALVIAGMIKEGRGGWMYEEIFDKVKDLGLDKRVIFTGFVENEEAPYLLAGAVVYVLPSLYEGFGISVLEAMAVGTPVVVSRASSLPEVCGKAAIYIDDPYKVESITRSLDKVFELYYHYIYNDSKEIKNRRRLKSNLLIKSGSHDQVELEGYRKLKELGFERVKKYNWEQAAKKTLRAILNI